MPDLIAQSPGLVECICPVACGFFFPIKPDIRVTTKIKTIHAHSAPMISKKVSSHDVCGADL